MKNYIYISIPKTGTNSIHEIMGHTKYNHITANTIKTIIGENEYNSKESFCFIRNPVDLVKSWYYYHKYNENVIRKDVKNFYPNTIEEWVFNMNCKTHWQQDIHKKYNPDWDINMNPLYQINWITDDNQNIIVNDIFLFENIDIECQKLFGIKPKKLNSSKKNNYNLNPNTENKIKELFNKDIKFYNSLKKKYNKLII